MASVLSLQNDQILFELHDDASASIEDRSMGRRWTMGPVVHQEDNPIDVGHVWLRTGRSLCEQYPGRFRVVREGDHLRISVIGQLRETRGTFACSFATSLSAPDGHVDTHRPQPMHRDRSTAAWPSAHDTASIWQRPSHVPHCWHASASISAW